MDVTPTRPALFVLSDEDRDVEPGGPALTNAAGTRQDISPKAYEAMTYVNDAFNQGYAVQIVPLRRELPIDEAADALSMPRKELRILASRGDIPFRSSEYVDWVLLSDVIMLSRRLDGDREEMLRSFADEPPPTL
jgi:hypothetical protein